MFDEDGTPLVLELGPPAPLVLYHCVGRTGVPLFQIHETNASTRQDRAYCLSIHTRASKRGHNTDRGTDIAMPAAFLLALGLPGRLPDIMEEGRAVRGPSGALSDAREEILECTKPAPRSLLYSNASATKKGTCGVTVRSKNHPDHCTGDKGSWALNVASEHWAASECAALCSRCSNCNFFSFSTQEKDCSWFASCDVGALRTHIGD